MIHNFDRYKEVVIVNFLDILACHNDWLLLLWFLRYHSQ